MGRRGSGLRLRLTEQLLVKGFSEQAEAQAALRNVPTWSVSLTECEKWAWEETLIGALTGGRAVCTAETSESRIIVTVTP